MQAKDVRQLVIGGAGIMGPPLPRSLLSTAIMLFFTISLQKVSKMARN